VASPSSDSNERRPIRRLRLWIVACGICVVVGYGLIQMMATSRVPTPTIELSGVHPQVADGITSAIQVVETRPESGLAWGHLGLTLWAHEYSNEALVCFEQAEQLSQGEVRWPYFRGVILFPEDRTAAVAALTEAARRAPRNVLPLLKLGENLLETGQFELASLSIRNALKIAPDNSQAHFLAAHLASQQNQLDDAIGHAQQSLELTPNHAAVIALLARLLKRNDQTTEAEKLLVRLRNRDSLVEGWTDPLVNEVTTFRLDPYWNAYSASRMLKSGNSRDGMAMLQQLVRQFPDVATIRAQLVRELLSHGAIAEASRHLQDAPDDSPFELRLLAATTHLLSEEWEESERLYRDILQLKPDSPSLHSEFAFCLRQQGRTTEAIGPALTAVRLAPAQVSYRIELARILIAEKRIQEARQHLTIAAELDPENADVRELQQTVDAALAR
jgi:tetratricopeptide (TPR) repeat protein